MQPSACALGADRILERGRSDEAALAIADQRLAADRRLDRLSQRQVDPVVMTAGIGARYDRCPELVVADIGAGQVGTIDAQIELPARVALGEIHLIVLGAEERPRLVSTSGTKAVEFAEQGLKHFETALVADGSCCAK